VAAGGRRPCVYNRDLVSSVPSDDWVELATDSLVRAGYRRGGARRAMIELLGAQPCALSAREIEDALRKGERRVARASIYRVLEELERLGLVARIDIGRGMARYEALHDGDAHQHDHLICDGCGQITPFRDEELESTLRRVAERVALTVDEHKVILHGHCATCRA
jgi:Fur family transcriptional regulator, ferric uptake regulator